MMCSQNEAGENGGCFFSAGRGIVNDGTVMRGNLAGSGGCICEKCFSFFENKQSAESENLQQSRNSESICHVDNSVSKQ